MADDPERDIYPSKDVNNPSITSETHFQERVGPIEKRSVPHLSRSDLEDQFYKFKEENYELKKAAKKQEENLKKLATKMSRLLREKKSLESMNSPSHKRDLELEEMVEDLQDKVRQLEKTNSHLREKMIVAKQQVIMQVKRPYSHIPPKVNSGHSARSLIMPYASSASLRAKNIQNYLKKAGTTTIPPYAVNLLEEARNELSNLKMLISSQKTDIEQYEHENEVIKQKLRMREIEFEDELNALKAQLTQRQRQHVQENLDLIRLHRDLKQKNANYLALQTQCSDMEEKMTMLKLKYDHLVKEMDDLSARFKAEQKKSLELLGELQKAQMSLSAISELQGKITILQKENSFLRETNENFIKNALNIENQRVASLEDGKRLQMEEMLKEKISNLESSLEIQKKEKSAAQEELEKEKVSNAAKEEAYTKLKENFNHSESMISELKAKVDTMKLHNMGTDDLERAASLLKLEKENKLNETFMTDKNPKVVVPAREDISSVPPVALPDASLEELENLKLQLRNIEEEHTKTLKELNNVQELLFTQYSANEASQQEIKSLKEKINFQEKEFHDKLEEHSHLLDVRNARIQKLEKQLNDIAYGTQTFQSTLPNPDDEHLKTVELSKGENLFEIHIVKIDLTSDGIKHFHSSSPNLFLTWNFYEFELQSTPVISAKRPVFNYTAQYRVQVDDYFLCYLLEKTVTLELHESLGVNFKTFAACQLNFSHILSESRNRIYGTQKLIGIAENCNINFGTVEFWICLQIPMQEAFKYFKEKLKALKYIQSNKEKTAAAVSLVAQPVNREAFMNDLHIKVIRGINLKSRQKDVQPSTFCVYKFFDLPDQDTVIVPASNNPEYSDHRTFSIFVNADVEKYLRKEDLHVYVFDDNELDIASHIGRVTIPLWSLLQNKPVKGVFELEKNGKTGIGSVEVLVYWQFEFIPTSTDNSAFYNVYEPKKPTVASPPSSPSSDSDDDSVDHPSLLNVSHVQPPVPKPRTSIPSRPVTSTPMSKNSIGSSSEEESSSPKVSPVHSKNGRLAVLPESAKQSSRTCGSGNDFKLTAEIHSPLDGPSVQNKPQNSQAKRNSFSTDASDEEKPAFSDESEESENEVDVYSPVKWEHTMKVYVHHLVLRSDATVLRDDTVKLLYVEYRFLDYPLEELETPFSLPKAASPSLIQYNFEKVFTFKSSNPERWNLLAKMVFSDIPESSLIKFIVVSEPAVDEQDLDCEEIGHGSIDLKEVLLDGADKIQEDIIIFDAADSTTEIGQLNISIEALEVLTKLKESIPS